MGSPPTSGEYRPSNGRWVMPEMFDGAIYQRDAARRMVRRLATALRKLEPDHPLLGKIKKVL